MQNFRFSLAKKLIKKTFSAFGVAVLAMIFCVVGTVFAATNWSTWTADMTKSNGDVLNAASWNAMVNAVGELENSVVTAQATANSAISTTTTVAEGQPLPSDKKFCFSCHNSYPANYMNISGTWHAVGSVYTGNVVTICSATTCSNSVCYCF